MMFSGTPSRSELEGVRVAQLVRREAAPDAGPGGAPGSAARAADGVTTASAGGAVDDAEQRPDRHRLARSQPGLELFPGPVVHADLAAAAALAAAHEDRAAARVEVELGERERFVDAQPGAPEHDDQRRAARRRAARRRSGA